MTVSEFRDWIFDRSPEDNELWGDLEFTDAEIVRAMSFAAGAFRMVPPLIPMSINPACLPTDTTIFFDATAEALYKMKRHSLARNRFQYQAGNVAINDSDLKLESLDRLIKEMGATWRQEASLYKSQRNVSDFYGAVG